jgi:hypothetical protein
VPWGRIVMPPTPHVAKDGVGGRGALIVRGQASAVRCQDGFRRTHRASGPVI